MSEDWKSKYDWLGRFSEGLASVQLNGQYGFIDNEGNVVIPLKYDYAWSFDEGLARVQLKRKWGYVDNEGSVVIPLMYDTAGPFYEGLAAVQRKRYVDTQGNEYWRVKRHHQWCWINSDGDVFGIGNNPEPQVKLKKKSGFVDQQGHEYWDMNADEDRWQMGNR